MPKLSLRSRRKPEVAALLLLVLLACSPTFARPPQHGCPKGGTHGGIYSKLGVALCFQNVERDQRHLEILSPNASVSLIIDGYQGKFVQNGGQIGNTFEVASDSQVIWSPDSRAVLLTFSLGGLGPVKTGILYVHPDAVAGTPDLTSLVQKNFAAHHSSEPCAKDVNVGALSWSADSQHVILIAAVPSSSSCGASMGNFEAYDVSPQNGQVLAWYSEKDAIRKWRKILAQDMLGGN